MESDPLHAVAASEPTPVDSALSWERGPLRVRVAIGEPAPEEPVAVIAAGPSGGARDAVLAALLGTSVSVLRVPRGSYLVVRHGRAGVGSAYVPGHRQPYDHRPEPVGAGPALARPPRRVEMTLPASVLRHFTLVDTPDTGLLGRAGNEVLLDAVRRGGAMLFVISAEQTFTVADLDLLTDVAARGLPLFFVVTPDSTGGWSTSEPTAPTEPSPATVAASAPGDPTSDRPTARETDPEPIGPFEFDALDAAEESTRIDPISVVLGAHRAALLAAVPSLAKASWFALDPSTTDTAYLQRGLMNWAVEEGLRRASGNPPIAPGATRVVPVCADAADSDWEDRLDREVLSRVHRMRQHVALELAHTHLHCVQEIVFGGGCAGLPEALDHQVHALSLRMVAECDAAVAQIMDETAAQVFGETPDEGVRRRLIAAVKAGFADHRRARDLARVLLITRVGGVAVVPGEQVVKSLPSYLGATRTALLPPLGVALSGGCYQHWCNPASADAAKARSWLQRALREVELSLTRELTRRVEAVQLSLTAVLVNAIEHDILLK